ncbi:MAG: DUF192 domain-containing protein [Cyanobacteria bacterium J06638_28]
MNVRGIVSVSQSNQEPVVLPAWVQTSHLTVEKWRWGVISVVLLTLCGLYSCVPVSPEVEADTPPQTSSPAVELPSVTTEEQPLAQMQGQMLPITAEVELGGQKIGLEVARTRQQQSIGLMHRDAMPDDRGMLFPFAPARPVNFWMKNVRIPLDMVFIYEGQIVAIANDVPPCAADPCPSYGPERQLVESVIELRGGLAEELGLQVGDDVNIFVLEDPSEMPQ